MMSRIWFALTAAIVWLVITQFGPSAAADDVVRPTGLHANQAARVKTTVLSNRGAAATTVTQVQWYRPYRGFYRPYYGYGYRPYVADPRYYGPVYRPYYNFSFRPYVYRSYPRRAYYPYPYRRGYRGVYRW